MELSAWRKRRQEGEEFTTPSGLVVTLRRVSLLDLAERGEIPAPLASMVNKILDTKVHKLTVEEIPEYNKSINLLVKAAVISPPVADEPDETHVGIEELPMKDRLAIYNWCQIGEPLRPFRREDGESEAS
jgi:hypothetical protein